MNVIFSFCLIATLVKCQDASDDIVVVGGEGSFDGTAHGHFDVYSLDVKTGHWTTLTRLPTRAVGTAAVFMGSKLIVTGGYPNLRKVFALETSSRKWIETGTLPHNEYLSSAVVLNGAVYVMGGSDVKYYGKPMEVHVSKDQGKSWSAGRSSAYSYYDNKGTVHENNFYICGQQSVDLKACEKYDPKSDQWTSIASMKKPRNGFGVIGLGNYVYAIGGATGENEKYDPKTNKWSHVKKMQLDRYAHGLATDGFKIYAIGGKISKEAITFSVEVFDPVKDTWEHFSVDPLPGARWNMGVAYTAMGKVEVPCDPELPECGE